MANRGSSARGAGRDQESERQSRSSARGRTSAQNEPASSTRESAGGASARTGAGEPQQRGERGGSEGVGRTERERSVQSGREVNATSSAQGGTARRGEGTGLARQQGIGSGMGISPWAALSGSPFTMMRRMMDDMDRLFESVGTGRSSAPAPWSSLADIDELSRLGSPRRGMALWAPQLEMFERGNELVVRADLPGLRKEDVDVEIENGVLTVSGERRQEDEESRQGYYRSERSYGTFARSIVLPEGVSEDQCNATFKDGVLEITLPKPRGEQSRRRRIDIR